MVEILTLYFCCTSSQQFNVVTQISKLSCICKRLTPHPLSSRNEEVPEVKASPRRSRSRSWSWSWSRPWSWSRLNPVHPSWSLRIGFLTQTWRLLQKNLDVIEQLFYTIENVKKELPLVATMGGDGGAASNAGTAIQEYPISTPTQNQAVSTNVSWKLVKWQRLTGTHVGFNLLSSHSCDMCVPSRHIQLERSSRCGSSWSSHLDPIQICEHEHFIHEIRKQSQDVKEIILVQKSIPKKVLPQSNLVFILKS